MKMHQSRVLNHLHDFPKHNWAMGNGLCRNPGGMFLLWKTIEYFQPKKILEIGFFAGQSLGLMLEATDYYEEITTIDVSLQHRSWFDQLFPNNNIKFIEQKSESVDITDWPKQDFILVDGDHSYKNVNNDLKKIMPLLHEKSILCMDEYQLFPGVWQAIEENILNGSDWVPFLCGEQEMFFHHKSHSADYFLDSFIQHNSKKFLFFENQLNFDGTKHCVLKCVCPYIYHENNKMFLEALKFYNL